MKIIRFSSPVLRTRSIFEDFQPGMDTNGNAKWSRSGAERVLRFSSERILVLS